MSSQAERVPDDGKTVEVDVTIDVGRKPREVVIPPGGWISDARVLVVGSLVVTIVWVTKDFEGQFGEHGIDVQDTLGVFPRMACNVSGSPEDARKVAEFMLKHKRIPESLSEV